MASNGRARDVGITITPKPSRSALGATRTLALFLLDAEV